jgi:hypothetical protein
MMLIDRLRLKVAKRISLDDLIDGMEMQSEDVTAYLDCDKGEVVTINDEIAAFSQRSEPDDWKDWERELIGVVREVEKGSASDDRRDG